MDLEIQRKLDERYDARYVSWKKYNDDKESSELDHRETLKAVTDLTAKLNMLLWVNGVIATAAIGMLFSLMFGNVDA